MGAREDYRAELIRDASELVGADQLSEDAESSRFEGVALEDRELASALWTLAVDGEGEQSGATDEPGGCRATFGPFTLVTDEFGFCALEVEE